MVLAAVMTAYLFRSGAPDQELQRDDSRAKTGEVVRAESSRRGGRATNLSAGRDQAEEKPGLVQAQDEGVALAEAVSSSVEAQAADSGTTSEGTSTAVKNHGAKGNWPMPAKSRFAGKTVDYRSVELPPNKKGGSPGELREWLIEPEEGYTAHVEEEYRPDENGEMQIVCTKEYVANLVVLTLDGETSYDEFKQAMEMCGVMVKPPLMELDKGAKIVAVMTPGITFDSVDNLREVVAECNAGLNVEVDPIRTIERVPNDARYSSQWGLTKIQAPAAWDTRTDASDVVVGVLDTGVNYNHQDLAANMWVRNSSASASNYKYGMKSIGGVVSGNPLDDNGHGTHCAGIIGAVGDNSSGISGVAWRAKIMALKCLNASGSCSVSDEIAAMSWGMTNGVDIMSMSFGGYGYSSSEYSAISQLRSRGIITVCAAGNDTENTDVQMFTPAALTLDNIVSVASTTSTDALSSFSNYGATSVDIAAPGSGILSTVGVAGYGQYESWDGTSMAAPFVSGALALLKTQYPSYTYLQLIQKLYAGGDSLSQLSGKCTTGRRLNVYKAISGGDLVSPVPTASRGTYSDRVYVSWPSVSGATHYRVYRATSSTGAKTALGSWQADTSYGDYSVVAGTTYYYWVCAATSSSGANQSAYGSYSTGYSQASSGDSWDPGDDTPSGGTPINPTASRSTHGTHTLGGTDAYDFFKVSMTAGTRYTFETTGSMDTYGELFNSASTNRSGLVAYNDDADGSNNRNFRIEYRPSSSGTYYLRVRAYSVGTSGSYTLAYRSSAAGDSWDPADDTPSGGTLLTPITTEQTHGPHTLSADDLHDFFRINMTAGQKYVFESTGSSDVYGELFSSTSTNAAYMVAYNDDIGGSNNRNFRIEYTPTTTQTYYLRVRSWSVDFPDRTYSLKYSQVQSVSSVDAAFCSYESEWPDSVFLAKEGSTTAQDSFVQGDTVTIYYQWTESDDKAVPGPLTNCAKIVNQATGATRYTWQNYWSDGLDAGYYGTSHCDVSGLEAGAYTLRMALNEDKDGNHSIVESSYANNVRTISFTVVNSQKTLASISISGNASIASKAYADYRCRATYSDGSSADVSPTWSISSGSSYASVDAAGRVTAGDTTVDREVVLRAAFGGKSATKTIAIRGYAATPDPDDDYDPFGAIVPYPRAPMIVEGVLYINNVLATPDDMIAAYSGNEVRGIASTDSNGRFTMGVNIAESNERIIFKAYDASEGDLGTVFNCLQSLLGSSDPQGTSSSPLRFDALPSDPFGQVVRESLVPPTIIEASVTIDGEAASSGDILAVFSGNTIVGKASVVYENQNGDAVATCSVVMFFSGSKTLSFKLWDADEEEILESQATLRLSSGDVVGTAASPHEIAFSLDVQVPCPVSLRTGWNLVSFSALPESPTPANVFAEVSSSVQYVCDAQGNLWSPSSSNPGLSTVRLGEGYWVRSASGGVDWNVEGRGNPDTEISLVQGWNLIGYTLPRAGLVANVLRTALASGKVQYITDQSGNVYPGGSLTSIQPGVGYWVRATGAYAMKFESSGMETASASLAIMSADGVKGHPFGTPITRVGVPTIFDGVSVSVFGKPAAYGDYLAVFDRSTDELLAVQQVNTENGSLMFTIMGLGRNDRLYFKVWNFASGLDSPEIFTAAQSNDLTISSPDDPVVGLGVAITGTKPSYTVRYDLGGKATRTGGGALTQSVQFGGDAVDPQISVNSGWRFVDWDYSKRTDIRRDMTISALYEEDEAPQGTPSPKIGGTSKFAVSGSLQGTLVGMENVQWGNFSGKDQFGAKTLVHAGIHDAEKTAGANMKDDDTWCYPISDMNALFWTGWAQAKTSYANADAMVNYFRSNPTLLRTWRNGGPQEGQYGYDGLFDWFRDTTGQDLSGNIARGKVDRTFGSTIRPLLDDGGHVIRLAVYFSETSNPKWSWCNEYGGVSHGVLCVGYVADTSKSANDPAALKALFIVDPDNNQQTGSGGASAPNSIAYCPVTWRSASGTWSVEGIWGETSILCNVGDSDADGYRALANYSSGGGGGGGGGWDPATIRIDVEKLYETDADGSFSLDLAGLISSASTPKVTVKGLPTGLKYDAKGGVISGKVTKPGVYAVTVNVTNATVKKPVSATFEIAVPNIASWTLPNLYQDIDAYGVVMCGVMFDPELVDCSAERGWAVKVSGLPAGLKYDAKTGMITGVPTKAGTFTVTFTATKKGEPDQIATITLKTKMLPTWATGTFYGYADGYGGPERDWQQAGSATFTVSANGKATGKVALGGTNWTFAASYAYYSLDDTSEFLELDGQLKAGKATLPVSVYVVPAEAPYVDGTELVNAVVYSYNEYSDHDLSLLMWRNIWKDKDTAAAAKRVIADLEGVYTLSFYDGGYLSLAVAKDGNVKASGKLSDGTGVSMQSPMLYDGEEGGYRAAFYAAPSSYKGGALSLSVGFDNGEIVDLGGSWWMNRDPQASGTYGAAVVHDVEFFGAYYDKLAKLSAYYDSLRFELYDDLPQLSYLFKYTYIDDYSGRKVSESWLDIAEAAETLEQDGLTVAVGGNGALFVEKATKPVQDKTTKEWLYEGRNDGALTLSFTQATGIFKGSYTFWYDYVSAYDDTKEKETWTHASKKANFEGIFVQGAEPAMCGFLLWDAMGEYEDAKSGKVKTYKYKQSFPVSLAP